MKRKTLNKHNDFITTNDSSFVRSDFFTVKISKSKSVEDARYGVVAPKSVFHHATQRNRVKRLLRDWITFNENFMHPELDYVFFAGYNVLNADRETGRQEMKKILIQIAQNYPYFDNENEIAI